MIKYTSTVAKKHASTEHRYIAKNAQTEATLPDGYDWESYRAYVGPPEEYDVFSAMVFNLLTSLGLRQHHRILDIGCGSLRLGRLFMPYLNPGNYYGVEPNQWLVEAGIQHETGQDLIQIKKPVFCFADSMAEFTQPLALNYAVAQSIFSHCGNDLLENWLSEIAFHLQDDGALLATFLLGDRDYSGDGWIYPECVCYRPETMATIASKYGLGFDILDWAHPRQTWALFSKPGYDKRLIQGGPIGWNRLMRNGDDE
ncbi:MAG: Unknown protein [uncultured Thiotrichaceae bacterium]|uniref:Methyltransferase type 12 domain-containing protein n=1 Tax=uncultured Thiotrichaceae bacterium TaxID=298394 RepID=A0A6S6U212_9GAMM|nr:MAG: Unknown protein [uncultured Thiotrichaceae bacterium]